MPSSFEQLDRPVPVLRFFLRELGHAHLLFGAGRLAHPLRIHVRGEQLRAGLIREQTHERLAIARAHLAVRVHARDGKLALYHAKVPPDRTGSWRMTETWCNWSGSVRCTPQRRERPSSEAQLAALLRGAAAEGLGVRVAGRGHSHTPLVATDGLLLELDALAGIEACDAPAREATLRAGTPLAEIGAAAARARARDGESRRRRRAGARGSDRDRNARDRQHGCAVSRTRSSGLRLYTASGDRLECSEANDPRVFAGRSRRARAASG